MDSHCRVISIYSNGNIQSRFEYAINLAASLADISKDSVLVIDGPGSAKTRPVFPKRRGRGAERLRGMQIPL